MEQKHAYTYNIPANNNNTGINVLEIVKKALENESICVEEYSTCDRVFHYYDNVERTCLAKGWSLYAMSGFFDAEGNSHYYTFLNFGKEVGWLRVYADTLCSPCEINIRNLPHVRDSDFDQSGYGSFVSCQHLLGPCSVVATSSIQYHQFLVTFLDTVIEISCDLFGNTSGKLLFQKLECRFVKGTLVQLDAFCNIVLNVSGTTSSFGDTFSLVNGKTYQWVVVYPHTSVVNRLLPYNLLPHNNKNATFYGPHYERRRLIRFYDENSIKKIDNREVLYEESYVIVLLHQTLSDQYGLYNNLTKHRETLCVDLGDGEDRTIIKIARYFNAVLKGIDILDDVELHLKQTQRMVKIMKKMEGFFKTQERNYFDQTMQDFLGVRIKTDKNSFVEAREPRWDKDRGVGLGVVRIK